jgi:hypothetical protein
MEGELLPRRERERGLEPNQGVVVGLAQAALESLDPASANSCALGKCRLGQASRQPMLAEKPAEALLTVFHQLDLTCLARSGCPAPARRESSTGAYSLSSTRNFVHCGAKLCVKLRNFVVARAAGAHSACIPAQRSPP